MAPKDVSWSGDGPAGRKQRKSRKEQHRQKILEKLPRGGNCIEIGVWRGDFSKTLLAKLEPAHLTLVDAWADPETEEKTESLAARGSEELDAIHDSVRKRFKSQIESGRVSVVRSFSHEFLPGLSDNSVDFAYIDADHSFEGLSRDLELLLPKLRPSGIVMCDDYHRRGWWKDGVIRAVHEFLGRHPTEVRIRSISGAQIALERLTPMS